MKKSWKIFGSGAIALSSFGTMLSVTSCGTSKEFNSSGIITIQAESTWTAAMQEMINTFKTNNAKMLTDAGIKDIQILTMGAFDPAANLATKGFRDTSIPDVFLTGSDQVGKLIANKYLAPFSETSMASFVDNNIGSDANDDFVTQALATAEMAKVDGKYYGVPENIEGLVKYSVADSTTSTVTQFSNLWQSVGFFNTSTFNFRDVVTTNTTNQLKFDFNETFNGQNLKNYLKAGFKNMFTYAGGVDLTNYSSIFDKLANVSSPKVLDYLNDNQSSVAIIDGPWIRGEIVKKGIADSAIKASGITGSYSQFLGGWLYSMNARIADYKNSSAVKAALEKLIGEILKPANAAKLYKEWNKISPLVGGQQNLQNANSSTGITAAQVQEITAVYESSRSAVERPVDVAFGGVWEVYATTISSNAAKIIDAIKGSSALQDTSATELATTLYDALKTYVDNNNKAN